MPRSSFISSFKWPIFFIVAFFALDRGLANSRGFGRFLENYTDIAFDNPALFYEKLKFAAHEPGKPLAVIIGSSIARESIDDEIVNAALGNRAQVINLGFFHGRPVDHWMLSAEIAALKPQLVVLGLSYDELYVEYSYRLTFPFYFHARKALALIGARELAAHWRDSFYAFAGRASFLFRYRATIGSALLRCAKEKLGVESWYHRGRFRFRDEQEVLPALDAKLSMLGQDFVRDPGLNLVALEKLLAFYRQKGIRVVILPLQPHPKFEAEIQRLQIDDLLQWRKSVLADAQPHWGETLDPPVTLWEKRNYADYIHLNARGRKQFSLWFARWLGAQPGFTAAP